MAVERTYTALVRSPRAEDVALDGTEAIKAPSSAANDKRAHSVASQSDTLCRIKTTCERRKAVKNGYVRRLCEVTAVTAAEADAGGQCEQLMGLTVQPRDCLCNLAARERRTPQEVAT